MQEYRSELEHPRPNQKRSHGDNKVLDTVLCKICQTMQMGKKRKAEEGQEVEEKYFPRPSPFDELSSIFYPRKQEASRVGDSIEDHSLNPNDLEDTVKKGRELFLGVSPMRMKTEEEEEEYRLDHPLPNKKKSHGDNKMLNTVLCKVYRTPMGKKREAEEGQEVEDEDLPRPSPFDELSSIFYPRQQEASRVGDSAEDRSLNPKLSEDTVKEGREMFLGVKEEEDRGRGRGRGRRRDADEDLLFKHTLPLAVTAVP